MESKIKSILGTVQEILTMAGPLIVSLAGEGKSAVVKSVLAAIETATRIADSAIDGLEVYADELEEIKADLAAIQERGGMEEADFDDLADRLSDKTAKLRAVVDARKA